MSIQIVPQEQLQQAQQQSQGVVAKIPLLFLPSTKTCFSRRAERLRKLAEDHPLAEYLEFCANLADAQQQLIESQPIQLDLSEWVTQAADKQLAPLSAENFALPADWIKLCRALLNAVKGNSDVIAQAVSELQQLSDEQLFNMAQALRADDFAQVPTQYAPFIWATLAVYYAQLAEQLPGKATQTAAQQAQLCPVCHAHPVASVIHLGSNAGLRYLHCSLCESEWYAMRAKCTNCQADTQLDYFAFDSERAAIKTECCDQCHGYLKLLNQELDPYLEVLADDIASLMLDLKTAEEGFNKTGLNPFLFSQE